MSEMICPRCNAQSPENALYCQQCGQPLRCQDCGAGLLPTARACIQCGKLIPERSANDHFTLGMSTVLPGYNRLKLHETPDVRDVDLTVSNEAIAHIGDLLPSLVGTRPKGRNSSLVDQQPQKQSDLVEVAQEIPSPHPQLPAAQLQPALSKDSSKDLIWEIFRKQDGGALKQDIQKLKAATKKDYLIRLIYLYLYAKLQLGEDTVSRAEVYTILDGVGVKDGNTANTISQDAGISTDDHETLRLNYDGRKQVQQYIADVFNSDLTDGWIPGLDARSATNRAKKSSKKSSEQYNSVEVDVARWVSHEVTRTLAGTIPHSTVVNLPILDKAFLALYGIYRAGTEQEVPVASIAKYLYDAFQVQVESQALSTAFYKARQEKTPKTSYVNFVEGHGYKITPSGRNYIEESLNLKQPKITTTEVNAGSNGAAQS